MKALKFSYTHLTHTHTHTHTHTPHTPSQLLSSLKVLLSLPPPTSSTLSQDLHKQAANGITELVQARASLITQRSDWSILFTIIEYIGLGISPEQSSNVVAVETTEPSHDDTLQSDSSVIETQKDWVVVTDTPTINSFDLFSEPVLPVHEPQVHYIDHVHLVCVISVVCVGTLQHLPHAQSDYHMYKLSTNLTSVQFNT